MQTPGGAVSGENLLDSARVGTGKFLQGKFQILREPILSGP